MKWYKWKRIVSVVLVFVLLVSVVQNTGFRVSASEVGTAAADEAAEENGNKVAGQYDGAEQEAVAEQGARADQDAVIGQDVAAEQNGAAGQDDESSQNGEEGQDIAPGQDDKTSQNAAAEQSGAAGQDGVAEQTDADSQGTAEYQFFKDGEKIDTQATVQTDKEYDGYVVVQTAGTSVTVTAVAAEGYEFMMLNLLADGWLTTPLSKDYVKSGEGTKTETNGTYAYTFTVDSTQSTATEEGTIGSVYVAMPEIKAYFDVQGTDGNLLNDDLQAMTSVDSGKSESSGSEVSSWLNSANQLNAGTKAWGSNTGYDIKKGDYVVYDAGEGKVFDVTGISIYGRWGFAFDRFEVDIFGSNDGTNYEEAKIADTPWLNDPEKTQHLYSIRRYAAAVAGQYRYLKLKADCNITNISLLRIYGSVKDAAGEEPPVNPDEKTKTSYLLFRDGSYIGTVDTLDALNAETIQYDGYVIKVHDTEAKSVTVTPVAAEGYSFAILNLKDSGERVLTPVSCAYKHSGEWTAGAVSDGDYSFTYTYGAEANGSGNVYDFKEEPEIFQAYFDQTNEQIVITDYAVADACFQGYEKMFNGKIAAGSKGWDGVEFQNGNEVVFYSGDDKQFDFSEIILYGRSGFGDDRFSGVEIYTSADGITYTMVHKTVNPSHKYGTPRYVLKDISAPYIKFKSTGNNRNLSTIKFYGAVSANQMDYLSLKELLEEYCGVYEGEQGRYGESQWNAFRARFDEAKTAVANWEAGNQTDEAKAAVVACRKALQTAWEELKESLAKVEYHAFQAGSLVETKANLADLAAGYDGYVKVTVEEDGKTVTMLPVPAQGREFSLLTLRVVDNEGNLVRSISPISRDYRRQGDNKDKTERITDGNYRFTFTLADKDGGEGSFSFAEIPEITAYFDKEAELMNADMFAMKKEAKNEMHGILMGGIHAGGKSWDDMFAASLGLGQTWGKDLKNGDYCVFYAGDGKQFSVKEVLIYGRANWADSRFGGFVLETSNDGEHFETVLKTADYSSEYTEIRKWETPRVSWDEPLYARYIKISSTMNNLNISMVKFYGAVEEDRTDYYYLRQTVEKAAAIYERGQTQEGVFAYTDASWQEFTESYEAAKGVLADWEDDTKPNPDSETTTKASGRLADAIENLAEGLPILVDTQGHALKHPAIGNSGEDLLRIREHIVNGDEPWASYFAEFSKSEYVARDYRIRNDKIPGSEELVPVYGYTDYASSLFNNDMKQDATAAYYQSIMYFMTGEVEYREKAMRILRLWSILNPAEAVYVNDAHIHHERPTFYFNCAAELLRYTSSTRSDLVWTQADTEAYVNNYLKPALDERGGWFISNDKWFNQHQTVVNARMSSMIFMDDKAGYEKVVEWYTVNGSVGNLYHNGAIINAYPELSQRCDELDGMPTATEPYIAVGEMVRDQPHSLGNVEGLMLSSRMLDAQGTLVDPGAGTVSTGGNAVSIYHFLDDRLIKGANYWCQYNLGEEGMPFYDSRGGILSDSNRGRISNLFEYYVRYKYELGYQDTDEAFRYVAKEYEMYRGIYGTARDESWLYIPEEAAGKLDTAIPYRARTSLYEFEEHGNSYSDATKVKIVEDSTASGGRAVEITPSEAGEGLAMLDFYESKSGKIALSYKSDQITTLEIRRHADWEALVSIVLPGTGGEWKTIVYDPTGISAYIDNQVFYFYVKGADTARVRLDWVQMKTSAEVPVFAGGRDERIIRVYPGMTLESDNSASVVQGTTGIRYGLQGDVPEGLTVGADGIIRWSVPAQVDFSRKEFYLTADEGGKISALKIVLEKAGTYLEIVEALAAQYDKDAVYESESLAVYLSAYEAAKAEDIVSGSSDVQNTAIAALEAAIEGLRLLNPLLEDGSLNYAEVLTAKFQNAAEGGKDATLPLLMDNDWVTYTGDAWDRHNKAMVFDFGKDFRFKATSFAFAPRETFASRTANMVVYASNDQTDWVPLTGFTTGVDDWQTVEVFEEQHNTGYRYFMVKQLETGAGHPMSFGEFRMFGERVELFEKLKTVKITSDNYVTGSYTNGGVAYNPFAYSAGAGDTITLEFTAKEALTGLSVTIEGQTAAVGEPAVEGGNYTYQAAVTLAGEVGDAHDAAFCITYAREDGTVSEAVSVTTDGSVVFASDKSRLIQDVAAKVTKSNIKDWTNAFDGRMDTWPGGGVHDYIELDFGEGNAVQLERIEVLPRYEFHERLTQFYVAASVDGENWRNITRTSWADTYSWRNVDVFAYDQGVNYRYLRLCGSAWYCNVAEVRLYGAYGKAAEMEETPHTYTVTAASNIEEAGSVLVYYTDNPEGAESSLSGIRGGSSVTLKAVAAPGYEFVTWKQKKEFCGTEYAYDFFKDSGAETIIQYAQGEYQGGRWYREVIEDMDVVAVFRKVSLAVDKSVLDSLVEAARLMERELDKYQEEGKAEFRKALAAAAEGQQDILITQDQVDALCESLKACMENLKLIDKPTESPEPSESPKPTESPEPSESPKPTESPEPSESPKPAESPEPSESPLPSESPKPAESSEPSESPKPTESPLPSESPKPTESQKPAESSTQIKQKIEEILSAVQNVTAGSSAEEKAAAVGTLVNAAKEILGSAADKGQQLQIIEGMLRNKFLDVLKALERKVAELSDRTVVVLPGRDVDVALEIVNKEINVPLGMDGEIRVEKVEVPLGMDTGAAVAFEFGLYYGDAGTPAENWQRYPAFDVPMIIAMALPDGIDASKPVKVYHFADGSSTGQQVYSELTENGSRIIFLADSFSTYVILNETGQTENPADDGSGHTGNGSVGTSASGDSGVTSPQTYDVGTGNGLPGGLAAAVVAAILICIVVLGWKAGKYKER